MGRSYNYSYTQPSSSEYSLDTSLLEAEAALYADDALYADEAESSYNIGQPDEYPPQPVQYEPQPVQYPPQPVQYICGGHATAEEMRDFQTQLTVLKEQVHHTNLNLAKMEQTVSDELSKKKAWVTKRFALEVFLVFCVLVLIGVLILQGSASKDLKDSI